MFQRVALATYMEVILSFTSASKNCTYRVVPSFTKCHVQELLVESYGNCVAYKKPWSLNLCLETSCKNWAGNDCCGVKQVHRCKGTWQMLMCTWESYFLKIAEIYAKICSYGAVGTWWALKDWGKAPPLVTILVPSILCQFSHIYGVIVHNISGSKATIRISPQNMLQL